jgi:hypothetical protein
MRRNSALGSLCVVSIVFSIIAGTSPASGQLIGVELVVNGDAGSGDTAGWTQVLGSFRTRDAGPCAGNICFWSGSGAALEEMRQIIDVSELAHGIDASLVDSSFSGRGYSACCSAGLSDDARLIVEFRSVGGSMVLASFNSGILGDPNFWQLTQDDRVLPVGTREIWIRARGSRLSGGSTEAYLDDISFQLDAPICADGEDNDFDGLIDLVDPSCLGDSANDIESYGTQCDDRLDNDSDGLVDLADPSCQNDPSNDSEALGTACDDGIDDDSDGLVDLADPGCLALASRNDESGEIVVNTALDKIDADTGDGICQTDVLNECSLRAAVMHANHTPGTQGVRLPSGTFELTLEFPQFPLPFTPEEEWADLDVTDSLVLIGAGTGLSLIEDHDQFPTGAIKVYPGQAATIADLTIREANFGVDNLGSSTLENVVIEGCGVGVQNSGTLAIESSTISGQSEAGIFNTSGTLSVVSSSVEGNSETGINISGGDVTLINSSVLANTIANGLVSGIVGAGIHATGGTATLNNTTVSGNSAGLAVGAAIWLGGAPGMRLTLNNTTITNNVEGSLVGVGGIYHGGTIDLRPFGFSLVVTPPTPVTMRHSIVAGNTGENCSEDDLFFSSIGHNLSDDNNCTLNAFGDLPATAAMLGPLADNGGPTLTHLPLEGSPVIDAGDNPLCFETDQRGGQRPIDGNVPADGMSDCDIGAVELPEPGLLLQLGTGVLFLHTVGRRHMRARSKTR